MTPVAASIATTLPRKVQHSYAWPACVCCFVLFCAVVVLCLAGHQVGRQAVGSTSTLPQWSPNITRTEARGAGLGGSRGRRQRRAGAASGGSGRHAGAGWRLTARDVLLEARDAAVEHPAVERRARRHDGGDVGVGLRAPAQVAVAAVEAEEVRVAAEGALCVCMCVWCVLSVCVPACVPACAAAQRGPSSRIASRSISLPDHPSPLQPPPQTSHPATTPASCR